MDPERLTTLRVGERLFTTRLSTLTEGCPYFAAKFSDKWSTARDDTSSDTDTFMADDDIPFLDADADAFAHVLDYLRQGTFPFLWNGKTFDLGLYSRVGSLANFLNIGALTKWIDEGK